MELAHVDLDEVFIFAGPSGVGKTELSKSLANFLFGSDDDPDSAIEDFLGDAWWQLRCLESLDVAKRGV